MKDIISQNCELLQYVGDLCIVQINTRKKLSQTSTKFKDCLFGIQRLTMNPDKTGFIVLCSMSKKNKINGLGAVLDQKVINQVEVIK